MNNLENVAESYIIFSLIDITKSDVLLGNSKERKQQINWETVLQSIGLRAQPLEIRNFNTFNGDMSKFQFGKNYNGNHKVWTFAFSTEHRFVFDINNVILGGLKSDINNVPMIFGLNETINPEIHAFNSIDFKLKNFHVIRL